MTDTEPAQREDRSERFAGLIAVTIALATLVAALAGFLQADANSQASNQRAEAEQLGLQALASSQAAQQTAQVELETFATWIEQRTRAGNAMVGALFSGSDPARSAEFTREQARWEALAAATLSLSGIDPESEFGPDRDPAFPARYFTAGTEESLRLNALQDAANEDAASLDQRAASYTAILATVAVSLYLFGLTLAVGERWLRASFLSIGLLLLGVGSLWLVQTTILPVRETNDEAAAEWARGRVALTTAFDRAGYDQAIAHFDRAIELRPTFARAYSDRSDAIFLRESPQLSGFRSIVPPEALERSRNDLEHARALGLDTAATYGSLGFYGFAEGVQEGDIGLLNQAAEFSRRAIALDPAEPVFRYNLAVTLVAAGRIDEARVAYDDAVARTLFLDAGNTDRRGEPFVEEQWLAGALTDLELVRRHRPDLDTDVRALKEHIVGRVAAGSLSAPTPSPAAFADIEINIFPAELQWQGNVDSYDAARDVISAQWYYQDPAGQGWAVIPEVSMTGTPSVGSDGRLFRLAPYLGRIYPPSCLPAGEYRVELYVNGRLAAEGSGSADYGALVPYYARDMTVAMCRPADWNRREDRVPGLMDGFQSTDLAYGAYVAHFPMPGSVRDLPDVTAMIEDIAMQSFTDLFPGTPTYLEDPGTQADYFMGHDSSAWRWYDHGSGYVRIGGGLDAEGAIVMGMVYGPYDWFNGDEPYRILNSMIAIE